MSRPLIIVTCIVLAGMSRAGAQSAGKGECPIFPVPKEYRVKGGDLVTLAGLMAIVLGQNAKEQERSAAPPRAYWVLPG